LLPWLLLLLVVWDWLPPSLRFENWSPNTRTWITASWAAYVLVDTLLTLWHVVARSSGHRSGRF
jgi:hypothetical protein